MGDTFIITPQLVAILGGLVCLALTVFGGVAKLLWNQRERDTAKVIALIKESDERTEKRFEKQEAKDEERHGEIRAELRDLNTRVSRLEGRVGVQGGSAGQSGQRSPQRDDAPASAPDSESDPAPVADDFDQSIVPLAGGRAEPQPAAGRAHQAEPDALQGGETDSEPPAEESTDTAR